MTTTNLTGTDYAALCADFIREFMWGCEDDLGDLTIDMLVERHAEDLAALGLRDRTFDAAGFWADAVEWLAERGYTA